MSITARPMFTAADAAATSSGVTVSCWAKKVRAASSRHECPTSPSA